MSRPLLPCGEMDGCYRCLPPWYPDQAQDTPESARKLYLATGTGLGNRAGVYNSWNSAGAVISGVSGATAPLYHSWDETVVAWQGGCGRGEHAHLVDPEVGTAALERTQRTVSITMGNKVFPAVPFRSTTPQRGHSSNSGQALACTKSPLHARRSTLTPTPISPSPGAREQDLAAAMDSLSVAASPSPRRREDSVSTGALAAHSYGLRWNEQGMVCSTLVDASAVYEELRKQGFRPRMLTTVSFIDAARFAEGLGPAEQEEGSDGDQEAEGMH
ncbi:hypothetical protein C8R43DRAFT_1127227 [Mycena crocata]|nr:hypothetical protein C8R43DRAFT_1127227 [Mycena crocata]